MKNKAQMGQRLALVIMLAASLLAHETSAANPPASTYTKASFIPPAAPSSIGWPSAAHPTRLMNRIATGYGTYHRSADRPNTAHSAKRRGGSSGGGSTATQPASKKGKIQVMLLQTVPDIGQSGDIVLVSSAVFQNQLKRNGKARLITEEEIQKMEQEKEEQEEKMLEMAIKTKNILEEAMLINLGGQDQCPDNGQDICGVALTIKRKAGPEGNLFGGVNPKMVMDALKETFPSGSWDGKQVKIAKMTDSEGKDVAKMDIKHIGEYTIEMSLGKDVDVCFILSIAAE
ncbi:hypothetical protein HJC23_004479 [Cyclotella cryptica]|uniref:50S ribosomal protein L9, chloroplastic n=1 Tax=Cyclotella cryptica TaxID=29204 RepID=A0ABD3PT07_9STRA|eukprot:CCRYP_011931-RA/>CCRYP_011931-RA protein AED:0.06 eAED:0.06 QI:0/-1/0/1/-1/1/1/0/286